MTITEAAVQASEAGPGDRVPVFELRDVWKVYGEDDHRVEAVAGVDLEVYEGDFVAIMGPSGSGKSTLLHLIGLLDRPSAGEIVYRGREVSSLDDNQISGVRNQEVGFVFQSFHLLARVSALTNVELPLVYRGESSKRRQERAEAALDVVSLMDRKGHEPSQLSGGQRQRVAIARALAAEPAILLADEPTGNLDSKTSLEIMQLLTQLNRELGITIILITHEPDVAAYADRKFRMADGHLDEIVDLGSIPPEVIEARAAAEREVAERSNGLSLLDRFAPTAAVDKPKAGEAVSKIRTTDLVQLAFGTLVANKMRSALTSLGVIIGVMAVVLLVALGAGARSFVTDQIESLGSNLVMAVPGTRSFQPGAGAVLEFESPLTARDIDQLTVELQGDALVAGVTQTGMKATSPVDTASVRVSGVTDHYLEVAEWSVEDGRFFTPQEAVRGERVALLTSDVADTLYPGGAVGRQITVGSSRFEVIGVLPAADSEINISMPGTERARVAIVPIASMERITGNNHIDRIFLQAHSSEVVPVVVSITERVLTTMHPETEFQVVDQEEILGIVDTILAVLTYSLTGIAAISLVVGGIGIMNVTLVGVTERTREIGVRRAIGARSRHVLLQFLLEAIVTSSTGGLIGLALAVGAARGMAERSPIPAEVTPWAVALALGVSLGTGVFFGVWPAYKASRLNPVEALRHE